MLRRSLFFRCLDPSAILYPVATTPIHPTDFTCPNSYHPVGGLKMSLSTAPDSNNDKLSYQKELNQMDELKDFQKEMIKAYASSYEHYQHSADTTHKAYNPPCDLSIMPIPNSYQELSAAEYSSPAAAEGSDSGTIIGPLNDRAFTTNIVLDSSTYNNDTKDVLFTTKDALGWCHFSDPYRSQAYESLKSAENILINAIERLLVIENIPNCSDESDSAAYESFQSVARTTVSTALVPDSLKVQLAMIAASKIALLTNHFHHHKPLDKDSENHSFYSQFSPYDNNSHYSEPHLALRQSLPLHYEVIITAATVLALCTNNSNGQSSYFISHRRNHVFTNAPAESRGRKTGSGVSFDNNPAIRDTNDNALSDATLKMFPFLSDTQPKDDEKNAKSSINDEISSLCELLTNITAAKRINSANNYESILSDNALLNSPAAAYHLILASFTHSLCKLLEAGPDDHINANNNGNRSHIGPAWRPVPAVDALSDYYYYNHHISAKKRHNDHIVWKMSRLEGTIGAPNTRAEYERAIAMYHQAPRCYLLLTQYSLATLTEHCFDLAKFMQAQARDIIAACSAGNQPDITGRSTSLTQQLIYQYQHSTSQILLLSSLLAIIYKGHLDKAMYLVSKSQALLPTNPLISLLALEQANVLEGGIGGSSRMEGASGNNIDSIRRVAMTNITGGMNSEEDDKSFGMLGSGGVGLLARPLNAPQEGRRKSKSSDSTTQLLLDYLNRHHHTRHPLEGGLLLANKCELMARRANHWHGVGHLDTAIIEGYQNALCYYDANMNINDIKTSSANLRQDELANLPLTPSQQAVMRRVERAKKHSLASVLLSAGHYYLTAVRPKPDPTKAKQSKKTATVIYGDPFELYSLQSPFVSVKSGGGYLAHTATGQVVRDSSNLAHLKADYKSFSLDAMNWSQQGGKDAIDISFEQSMKKAQQLLEKALVLTREVTMEENREYYLLSSNPSKAEPNEEQLLPPPHANIKAGVILTSLAIVYAEMNDYLYATGLFASAERAIGYHFGGVSMELLDALSYQESYQRTIGAAREAEMTFKKMRKIIQTRRDWGLL